MPKIRYLHKTREGISSIYPKKSGDILQNMNFSRYYRNRGKFIYGFDPNINIISTKTGRCRKNRFLQRSVLCRIRSKMLRKTQKKWLYHFKLKSQYTKCTKITEKIAHIGVHYRKNANRVNKC